MLFILKYKHEKKKERIMIPNNWVPEESEIMRPVWMMGNDFLEVSVLDLAPSVGMESSLVCSCWEEGAHSHNGAGKPLLGDSAQQEAPAKWIMFASVF